MCACVHVCDTCIYELRDLLRPAAMISCAGGRKLSNDASLDHKSGELCRVCMCVHREWNNHRFKVELET